MTKPEGFAAGANDSDDYNTDCHNRIVVFYVKNKISVITEGPLRIKNPKQPEKKRQTGNGDE